MNGKKARAIKQKAFDQYFGTDAHGLPIKLAVKMGLKNKDFKKAYRAAKKNVKP